MSPRLSYLTTAFLLSVATLHAGDRAPAPAPTPAQTEPDPAFELKNRSQFTAAESSSRAPFWPIGWVKRKPGVVAAAPTVAAPKVLIDEKSFKVTSILIGTGTTPSLAVINGRAYSEGEFLRMPKVVGAVGVIASTARIRVQRINDGTVILQNADQTLVASLVRPELPSKRPEDLLLDPDR